MANKGLTDFKGITFDIIGTLADYEAGLIAWCRPHLPEDLTDNQILECFAEVEKELHVSPDLNKLVFHLSGTPRPLQAICICIRPLHALMCCACHAKRAHT